MYLSFVFISQLTDAAVIKGKITDEKNEALSFVTVYVKGSNTGTTCNEQGNYELKIDAGTYEIVFQYIGYKKRTEKLSVSENEIRVLNISLVQENYSLGEINVRANAEDPAYPIMRQAMAMRKVYLFEPKEYNCTVYLKGMQRLTTIPKRILLFKVPTEVKPGIIYLSESLSELSYQQPNKIKEKMISSKVSGDNKAFSFNRAGAIKFNLYENLINSFGLSERGFVSPLSSNAFLYYRFKLEGETAEGVHTVYKIKLIPIRENDPVFRGHIYIVKDSWRLHSTDLLVNKSAGVEFVDTLYIKQTYAQQPGGVWMPVSQRFIFQLQIMGFRGNGYFVAMYSKYKVNSMYPETFYSKQEQMVEANERVPEVKKVQVKKVEKKKAAEISMFDKKHFSNEVLAIDKKANKTDDSLWSMVRPVPLTEEEVADYNEKDNVRVVKESKPYLDSIDRINNKPDFSNIFITGYSHDNSFRKRSFSITPPLAVFQFNTVEGLVFNPRINYSKYFDDNRYYSISPNLRYGFASDKLYAVLHASYESDAVNNTRWSFSGGSFVEQFNGNVPISPALNTFYTLIDTRNYLKEYEKNYIRFGFGSEVKNGINLRTSIEYAQRNHLSNNSNYSFPDEYGKRFTSNDPVSKELPSTAFNSNNALILNVGFTIKFAQKYISRPDMKVNFSTKYPVLTLGYSKGLYLLGSVVDYDKITAGVSHKFDLKLLGKSDITLKGGVFLNNAKMYFMDYHHFNGNLTNFAMGSYNGFQLLDYYLYSTKQSFAEAHYAHHFNGFFLNKIPFIRKLKWQEVASLNFLKTPSSPNYIEFGAGVEHIFKIMRVDFFTSFEDGTHMRNGIVLGFGF